MVDVRDMQERDLKDLQRGLKLLREGNNDEARTLLVEVRERSPELPDAHLLAAVAARGLGRTTLALREVERAIEVAPDLADLHANRGAILCDLERYDEAEAALLEALRRNPKDPEALGDLGRVLLHLKRPEEALTCLEPVAAVMPTDAGLHSDIGVALIMARRVESAIRRYETALRLAPEDAEIHANYSRALLLANRYEDGWRESEWRFRTRQYALRDPLPYPVWEGEPLEGKSVLLIAEQGFGDTLQMIRFAPVLAQKGARVIVSCAHELVRLIEAMPSVDLVFAHGVGTPSADYCVPMLSLPRVLGLTPQTIPDEPYLCAPEGVQGVELPEEGLNVGLTWSGKTNRTLSFDALEPLLKLKGLNFVNFQLGPQAYLGRSRGMIDVSSKLDDFATSAAIIAQLDVVVAADTAVAHLAAALGKKTIVLLHRDSDWRWGLEGDRTPWYPSAVLCRQDSSEGWSLPIESAVRELERMSQVTS